MAKYFPHVAGTINRQINNDKIKTTKYKNKDKNTEKQDKRKIQQLTNNIYVTILNTIAYNK
jgi:hypothetical protein